jgi:hypothetical protein
MRIDMESGGETSGTGQLSAQNASKAAPKLQSFHAI